MVSSSSSNNCIDRLNQALNLGTRNGGTWQCSDIQIQRQVLRSINAFIDSIPITADPLHLPDVKDTISGAVSALAWILEHTNIITLGVAVDATVKFFGALPPSILQPRVLPLVSPLCSLVSHDNKEVAISCAKSLNTMIRIVGCKDENAVSDILKEKGIVGYTVSYVQSFNSGSEPVEYFQTLISLLGTILRKWPQYRFFVWSNDDLIRALKDALVSLDSCGKVEVLKLLSAIALCGSGAMKLIENGESFLNLMVKCMGSSQPHSVQVEAFKLARYLALNEERFSKMMRLCCEPFVKAIVVGMSKVLTKSGDVSVEDLSVAEEACRLALIVCWGGEHHVLFWKLGIGKVLLNLLLQDSYKQLRDNSLSMEDQLSIVEAGLNSSHLLTLRSYVWHILGWLAIHCKKGFNPKEYGQEFYIYALVLSACSTSKVCLDRKSRMYTDDSLRSESATRAVLMMIYSPCAYIASKARSILHEILKSNSREIMRQTLSPLKRFSLSRDNLGRDSLDRRLAVVYVMTLACHVGLPDSRAWLHEFSGLRVLLTLVRWCLTNHVTATKLSFSHHLGNSFVGKTCCDFHSEDWEGKDGLLFYSVWGLAEYIQNFEGIKDDFIVHSGGIKYNITEIAETLQDVCTKVSIPGVRWLASYGLTSLGFYSFPGTLAKSIRNAHSETSLADTRLVLKSGEHLSVHGIILSIRCPALLRLGDKTSDFSEPNSSQTGEKFRREIRLGGCIDHLVLKKLLEYVYLGYLQAEEEHVKLLKSLAKHCRLSSLQQLLSRQRPNWGAPLHSYDLSLALGPLGHRLSDVIFEANETELPNWTCDFCSSSEPHMHVHKIILESSSCDYLRALVNSGLLESRSRSIKVDLKWKAMVKLMTWLYTDTLPSLPTGCVWENSSIEEKLNEIQLHFELVSMSEYWCFEDLTEACSKAIQYILDSNRQQLSFEILKLAFHFSSWKLAEIALAYAAPFYRQLKDCGELENLDKELVEAMRSASVHTHRRVVAILSYSQSFYVVNNF